MALSEPFVQQLKSSLDYFNRSTRVLAEEDSTFTPKEGMMSVAQQVAHAAQTVDWFLEGATRPEGFDLNFEEHAKAVMAITSLTAARKWMDEAYGRAVAHFEAASDADLMRPLPQGMVMGGAPVVAVIWGIIDHTSHHRGALTAYSRLLGKVPVMPYMG